jgi:hypothetical protein
VFRPATAVCTATAHSTASTVKGKLKQHAVSRGLDYTTAMLGHHCIGNTAVFTERPE